ncbi:glycosyltransferase [Clostridium botulinum]|uniref:glycosyltransferase n=1 Tax=Clostridium botulinum TaxID=1491 RepID=UPI000773B2BB|nr:glycosyltransferase [Clostridium botulinum]
MKHVEVIMSSYNGQKYIERQLDTIFNQKDVFVTCTVRDDGSVDNTLEILKKYQKKNTRLKYIKGKNMGWERSFLEALRLSRKADYYAFADQDDEWFTNKLWISVSMLMKEKNQNQPLLFHCNKISTDSKLKPLKQQAKKISKPINKKNALVQEYVQGCSAVINDVAKEMICNYIPKNIMPHDYWIGLLCYYFGKTIYYSEPLFYHINHENNASQDGHLLLSRINRFKQILKRNGYPNPVEDLLKGYSKFLSVEDIEFLKNIMNYKQNFRVRVTLLFDKEFCRISELGTAGIKWCILFGEF